MPTYEYACKNCGEHLEVVQSFRDDPLTECPSCGGELRKVFHSIGISFKGSGFYKNDSRPAASKDGGSKDGGSKDAGTKEGGSKDTPAAKPAASAPSSTPSSSTPSTSGSSAAAS